MYQLKSHPQFKKGKNNKKSTPIVTQEHAQQPVHPVASKVQTRVRTTVPFNIIENMNRMSITMSMWDFLSIPGQTDLLREALTTYAPSQIVDEPLKAIFTNQGADIQDDDKKRSQTQGKDVKPPPFYVSLIIGNNLVHNCMVDRGAPSSIMPKKIVDQLGLEYEALEKGII